MRGLRDVEDVPGGVAGEGAGGIVRKRDGVADLGERSLQYLNSNRLVRSEKAGWDIALQKTWDTGTDQTGPLAAGVDALLGRGDLRTSRQHFETAYDMASQAGDGEGAHAREQREHDRACPPPGLCPEGDQHGRAQRSQEIVVVERAGKTQLGGVPDRVPSR